MRVRIELKCRSQILNRRLFKLPGHQPSALALVAAAALCLYAFLINISPGLSAEIVGSQSKKVSQRHNVLLFIADDQGLDMGAYGNNIVMTPNLDILASKGTLFQNAFATVSSCSPSRSVIFSGLYSHSNGMYGLAHDVHNQHLLPWVHTLPELLKQKRYATALVGKKHIKPDSALPFDAELAPEGPGKRDVALMAKEATGFIKQHDDQPFFVVIAFSDPHRASEDFGNAESATSNQRFRYHAKDIVVPSHLPDYTEVQEDLAEYYEAITRLDGGVGLVMDELKALGKDKDTLVIFLSDNGRPFPGAKTTLYDDGIHLPLLMVSPDQTQHGLKNDALVSWIDIVPTILEWTGAKAPTYSLPGRSLLSLLDQTHPQGFDEIYASHCFHEIDQYYPMRAVRTRKYKYIANLAYQLPYPLSSDIEQSPSWKAIQQHQYAQLGQRPLEDFFHRPAEELYDIESDPQEVRNLAADPAKQAVLTDMRARVKTFQSKTGDPWLPGQTSAFAFDHH